MSKVCIIAAVARNGVIGNKNKLPWDLPEDLKYFMRMTSDLPYIVGRKTHESIGRALPGRPCIVVSRTLQTTPDVTVVDSIARALVVARSYGRERVFVIGGADIYRQAMPLADELYLTVIQKDYEGDTLFPLPPQAEWRLLTQAKNEKSLGYGKPLRYQYNVYERVTDTPKVQREPRISRICTAHSGMSYT